MLEPLTVERMARIAGDRAILIALSGGGDSVALLHLLAERLDAARLHAAIVDHKLRESAAAEAQTAADIARAAGVEPHLCSLAWPAGGSRGQEAARVLRYAALCATARRIGAAVIATGHTRDDQAETVLLRASRGSGLRGLAGMRAVTPAPGWPHGRGLWLARPLLHARRAELRAFLRTRGARWIEDPSNEREKYARVRARRVLAELHKDHGLDPMRFAQLAERLRPWVRGIDQQAAALINSAASFEDADVFIERVRWAGDAAVKRRALEALIVAAAGAERGPAPAPLEQLAAALESPGFSGATLAGAWLQAAGARIAVRRDPGALAGRSDGAAGLPPLGLAPGQEAVWDGRAALTVDEPGWAVVFDGRAPVLQRGEERRPFAAASPHWLLKEHVQHVLGSD